MHPRKRLSQCTFAFLLVLTTACYSVSRQVTAIGGGWSIEKQTMHGSEPSLSKLLLYRGRTEVAGWVDRYEFFAPDCVIFGVPLLCAADVQQSGVERLNDDQLAVSEVSGGVEFVGVQAIGAQFREWRGLDGG